MTTLPQFEFGFTRQTFNLAGETVTPVTTTKPIEQFALPIPAAPSSVSNPQQPQQKEQTNAQYQSGW